MTIRARCRYFSLIFLSLLFVAQPVFAAVPKPVVKIPQKPVAAKKTLNGSYRCTSYNVSGGGGGNCRLFAPIVLKSDGTYSVSSEKGTYIINGDKITLSKSTLRGVGTLLSNDNQIRFEYKYNGWNHVITYLREGGSASLSTPSSTVLEVPVQVILEYAEKDSALGSIATVELVPEGSDIKTATYKPTALAVYDGNRKVVASFHKATSTPRTGIKYKVYTSTGASTTEVGTLDLTKAKSQVQILFSIAKIGIGSSSPAKQKEVVLSNAPEIVVEIDLVYSQKMSGLSSINFISLVPDGDDPTTTLYKVSALAIYDGDRTINGSFHKTTNQVKIGAQYAVYTDNGFGLERVGVLDLKNVKQGPLKKMIPITLTSSSKDSVSEMTPSGGDTQASSGKPCDPNIPNFSQPGCIK